MEGLEGGGGGETRGLIMHLGVQHRGLQNTSCLSVCLSLPEENTVALKALILTRLAICTRYLKTLQIEVYSARYCTIHELFASGGRYKS